MPCVANTRAYAAESALCPTDAAAWRLGMSFGRRSIPRASRPQAMAADVTTIGFQPAAFTQAIWSATVCKYA